MTTRITIKISAAPEVITGLRAANFLDKRLPLRFWDKVTPEPNSGCWLWTASCDEHGYATICFNRRTARGHRLAYETLVGGVPKGLELDHLCRTRRCVNPAHLEPVTHAENTLRGRVGDNSRLKTHCPRGHAYDEANTYLSRSRRRHCRTCQRARQGAQRQARRGL